MLITLVAFFGVLAVLILSHELGHFLTAKASRVRIEEFGLGFPPRLFSIRRGETVYSLNMVPLGGFVKLAGEEDPTVPGSFASKSISRRLLILSAGSLMNFLLPILLFSIALMIPHDVVVGQVVVEEVAPDSPAARAGIRADDTILSLNGKLVRNNSDLRRYVYLNLGKEITMLVQRRDSSRESVRLIPRWQPPQGQGAIGVSLNTLKPTVTRQHYPFWKAIPRGVGVSIETFVLFKNGIVSMFIGTVPVAVAGPVGIARLTGEVAQAGISPLLEFAAFLSINLAIFNIFPLPALDGGRIGFVLLEWIRRGKRIAPKTERLVHLIGFTMLMMFVLAITYQDIVYIVSGESLIP